MKNGTPRSTKGTPFGIPTQMNFSSLSLTAWNAFGRSASVIIGKRKVFTTDARPPIPATPSVGSHRPEEAVAVPILALAYEERVVRAPSPLVNPELAWPAAGPRELLVQRFQVIDLDRHRPGPSWVMVGPLRQPEPNGVSRHRRGRALTQHKDESEHGLVERDRRSERAHRESRQVFVRDRIRREQSCHDEWLLSA